MVERLSSNANKYPLVDPWAKITTLETENEWLSGEMKKIQFIINEWYSQSVDNYEDCSRDYLNEIKQVLTPSPSSKG